MASTIKHILLNTLEDLTQRQLKTFCARLLDREGEPRVRRSAIEGQDVIVVVDVLVNNFTKARAGRVVVDTLRAIDRNDLAENLEMSLETLKPGTRGKPQPTVNPEVHFVDRHHSLLVQRIKMVPAILDQLLDHKVVNEEQYTTILAKATPQDQVRQLYIGPLVSSGSKGKDIFLSVLEKMEPLLIEDLRLGGQ